MYFSLFVRFLFYANENENYEARKNENMPDPMILQLLSLYHVVLFEIITVL